METPPRSEKKLDILALELKKKDSFELILMSYENETQLEKQLQF